MWILAPERRLLAPCCGVPLGFPFDLDAGAIDKQVAAGPSRTNRDSDRQASWRRQMVLKSGTPNRRPSPQEAFHKGPSSAEAPSEYHFMSGTSGWNETRLQRTTRRPMYSQRTPIDLGCPMQSTTIEKRVREVPDRRPSGARLYVI